MGSPQDIKNQLAQKTGTEKPRSFNEQVKSMLGQMAPSIKTVLPKQFDNERFVRIALSEVRKNPQLSQCSIESIGGALMQSAILGLEPGLHGHCYLVPRWNSKAGRLDAEFQIGYKGYIDLAHRTGKIATIEAEVVYKDDYFHFELGSNKKLVHKPNLDSETYGESESAIKYYCFIKFINGAEQFKVMTKSQIENHMRKHAPKNKNGEIVGPWKSDFDAMALKTVIRLGFKTIQISSDFQQQISRDETIANDLDNVKSVYDVIDIDVEEIEENRGA